jgi:6,7-dimethyl-8-ribityllumazine synthase
MANANKILIIFSNYYEDITNALMLGATRELESASADFDKIEVPGVLEIPAALAMAVKSKKFNGYVLLGCVIRGETTHYDIVANESARSIMELVCRKSLALGNGIQTVENHGQAWVRADVGNKNKGGGAASAALAMREVRDQLGA